jgi:hypothetical protein
MTLLTLSQPARRRRRAAIKTPGAYKAAILEHPLQAAVFEHWRLRGNRPDANMVSIPLQFLDLKKLGRARKEGFEAGIYDTFCTHCRLGAFWLELKRPKGGRLSEGQKEFKRAMEAAGQECFELHDLDAVLDLLERRLILRGKRSQ